MDELPTTPTTPPASYKLTDQDIDHYLHRLSDIDYEQEWSGTQRELETEDYDGGSEDGSENLEIDAFTDAPQGGSYDLRGVEHVGPVTMGSFVTSLAHVKMSTLEALGSLPQEHSISTQLRQIQTLAGPQHSSTPSQTTTGCIAFEKSKQNSGRLKLRVFPRPSRGERISIQHLKCNGTQGSSTGEP